MSQFSFLRVYIRGRLHRFRKREHLLSSVSVFLLAFTATLVPIAPTAAAECDKIVFSDVGWTDISATTALTSLIIEALGYETETQVLSVPGTFAALAGGEVDVFLGNWMPSMEADIRPYLTAGTVETVRKNLAGAKFTLATNPAGAALGIQDFADLATHSQELSSRIYGIEPGNDGNRLILEMIQSNAFGLSAFTLVESSEQGMLAEVTRATKDNIPIVFLGWEPHPMNTTFDLTYLTGGDAYFGPNFGEASVMTVVRAGYRTQCPNIAAFLTNLVFSLRMEDEIMAAILNDGLAPRLAARLWLTANPSVLESWLAGVTSRDGGDALAAVQAAFPPILRVIRSSTNLTVTSIPQPLPAGFVIETSGSVTGPWVLQSSTNTPVTLSIHNEGALFVRAREL
jgi:glycine betaine/proline transport system substrate-binding protein